MKTVYNIIIADDHKMFVDGLRSILEQEDDLHI
ncbi:MAG TPA: DNA-binding response regulator, partial [Zunongwangia profunda]|nr:DNA-binding response regulator [Zunongwangia profunda]